MAIVEPQAGQGWIGNVPKVEHVGKREIKSISEAIRVWRDDPVQFVRDNFGVEPDEWQKDTLRAYGEKQCLAMKASKGCGKTTILSWIGWHYLCTRPAPKIAAISVSKDNLRDGLWTEMAKWMAESPFISSQFKWTAKRIFHKDYAANWYMSARSYSKSADPKEQAAALAGLHDDYMMFLIDEVSEIPDGILATAEAGLTSGIECKIVMAGNPTKTSGPLYNACTTGRHIWHVIEITSDPDDPKRTPRVDINWARRMIQQYGKDHPYVLINIMGKFPPTSLNALLGPDEVEAAVNRWVKEDSYKWSQKRLGIDVARFGDDSTIIFPRQGLVAFPFVEMKNARTTEIADRVIAGKLKWGSEREFVDGTGGFGAGVVDKMYEAGHRCREVHFNEKASDPQYFNMRAQMWYEMAKWIKRGGSIPKDDELKKELCAPFYYFKGDKIIIESKDEIKSRLGWSTDRSDALALTFAEPDSVNMTDDPYGIVNQFKKMKERPKEYDPFSVLNGDYWKK
jgi:hypothetical protein